MSQHNSMERIASLDLLRGIAILGILFMNIVVFAMPEPAYPNVNWTGAATDTNKLAFAFQYLFAKERFISLFCVLFGAGLVVFWQRAQAKNYDPFELISSRLGWLVLFGALHLTFLFYGDILLSYAVCGLLIYKSVALDERKLMRRGIIFLSVGMFIMLLVSATTFIEMDTDTGASMMGYPHNQESVNTLIESATGNYANMIKYNLTHGAALFLALPILFWIVGGMMLIGMSLAKRGFFLRGMSNLAELSFFTLGTVMSVSQLSMIFMTEFSVDFWFMAPINWIGGFLLILAVASRLIKIVTSRPTWLMMFQYAGKMALSLYIFQSITMTILFRGILVDDFGLWQLEHLMAIAAIMTVIQIGLAYWWQTTQGQGPLEKLWRSLIYKNAKPIPNPSPSTES